VMDSVCRNSPEGRDLRSMRILFVVNGFAAGGGELKLLELISELKRRYGNRYRAVVAAVGQSGPLREAFEGIADRTVVLPKNHPYDLSQVAGLARLIREERIDLVQTTLFYADVIGTLAARLAGVKRIVSWEAFTQPYGAKQMAAYRIAAKGYTVSVSVSEAIRDQVRRERHVPAYKTQTIRYGVDKIPSGFRRIVPERAGPFAGEIRIRNRRAPDRAERTPLPARSVAENNPGMPQRGFRVRGRRSAEGLPRVSSRSTGR